jgi:RNA polymerase primary sigma factor
MKQDMGKGLLVLKIAKEYQSSGLTEGELVEAGFNGLRKAAKKYGIKAFIKFDSCGEKWIRQSILQAIEDKKK